MEERGVVHVRSGCPRVSERTAGKLTLNLSRSAPEPDTDLSGMTKAELLAYAEEHGISGVTSSMTKAEIIETIVNTIDGAE